MVIRKKKSAEIGLAIGAAAVQSLVKYLKSDAGQAQLRRAPDLVRWAKQRTQPAQKYPGAIETTLAEASDLGGQPHVGRPQPAALRDGGRRKARGNRFNPAEHFGQRGVERRIAGLRQGLALAFGDDAVNHRPEIFEALAEIDRAAKVAASLPFSKRQRLLHRIGAQLDKLELALADAALPAG